MNLILSGRGVDLDEPLRRYAEEKLARVERFFDRIIKMEVELARERSPRIPDRVAVTVKTPHQTLRVHGEGADHYAAIDAAADRLEAQIKKLKERRVDHHNHHNNNHNDRDEALLDRLGVVDDDDDDAGPVIVRVDPPVDKPLTPEEARFELDDRGLAFIVFIDAESMRPAVLYKRPDGTYGLVEAEG